MQAINTKIQFIVIQRYTNKDIDRDSIEMYVLYYESNISTTD